MVYTGKRILELGNLVRTHGVKGNLVLRLLPGWNENILNDLQWIFLMIRNKPVPFQVSFSQALNDKEIQVQLDGVDTKEAAEVFLHTPLAMEAGRVRRKKVTDNLSFLSGYRVMAGNVIAGTIKIIESHGPQLLFVLDNGILIPAHEDFIVEIDDKKKEVKMQLPEGLLDINKDNAED